MKILFYVPHLNTIYAGRTIYAGYKNAFEDMGHEFKFMTADDTQKELFTSYSPDMLFLSLGTYSLKFLDIDALTKQRLKGMKVFVNTPFWVSPISKFRINEQSSISENAVLVDLIKSGNLGDIYYNISVQGDPRMEGFEEVTGYKHYTIPLAADRTLNYYEYSKKFKSDISYLGTNLPGKRKILKEWVYPLRKKYDLNFYGQDWTYADRLSGNISKFGKYFNIPVLKDLQKAGLELEDERRIYSSAKISINIHEDYQKEYGSDCNERTFKIPLCGGFEIVDDVACIRDYFKDGEEIIIAKDRDDWFEKIDYYMTNPQERVKIIEAGRARVLKDHTYHNRIDTLIDLYNLL